jgi:hypothetical protein
MVATGFCSWRANTESIRRLHSGQGGKRANALPRITAYRAAAAGRGNRVNSFRLISLPDGRPESAGSFPCGGNPHCRMRAKRKPFQPPLMVAGHQ